MLAQLYFASICQFLRLLPLALPPSPPPPSATSAIASTRRRHRLCQCWVTASRVHSRVSELSEFERYCSAQLAAASTHCRTRCTCKHYGALGVQKDKAQHACTELVIIYHSSHERSGCGTPDMLPRRACAALGGLHAPAHAGAFRSKQCQGSRRSSQVNRGGSRNRSMRSCSSCCSCSITSMISVTQTASSKD